jgi:ribosomal protein L24E
MKLCFSHIGGDAEVWKFGEVPNNKTWIHCAGNLSAGAGTLEVQKSGCLLRTLRSKMQKDCGRRFAPSDRLDMLVLFLQCIRQRWIL